MAGVSRVGIDSAGGVITDTPDTKTTVSGAPIAVVGSHVASHGLGAHASAVIISGASRTTANGIPVCRAGSIASCGHTATGGIRTTVNS